MSPLRTGHMTPLNQSQAPAQSVCFNQNTALKISAQIYHTENIRYVTDFRQQTSLEGGDNEISSLISVINSPTV